MNDWEKYDFLSIGLIIRAEDSFFRLVSTLLNRLSRRTDMYIVRVTLALISAFNCTKSPQTVINKSRLISLGIPRHVRFDTDVLTVITIAFFAPRTNLSQTIADGACKIFLSGVWAKDMTFLLAHIELLDTFLRYFSFLNVRQVLNSDIFHGNAIK